MRQTGCKVIEPPKSSAPAEKVRRGSGIDVTLDIGFLARELVAIAPTKGFA